MNFNDWYKGLIEEDKELGLYPVNRPIAELRKMHDRYEAYEAKRKSRLRTNNAKPNRLDN